MRRCRALTTLALRFASGSSLSLETPAFVALHANLSDKKRHATERMRLEELSDVRLLVSLDTLVSSQRTCMADIVAHLAELDARPTVASSPSPRIALLSRSPSADRSRTSSSSSAI
jgi:hypothetical protein